MLNSECARVLLRGPCVLATSRSLLQREPVVELLVSPWGGRYLLRSPVYLRSEEGRTGMLSVSCLSTGLLESGSHPCQRDHDSSQNCYQIQMALNTQSPFSANSASFRPGPAFASELLVTGPRLCRGPP